VDGVTKLSQLEVFSERTKQAENFRKLMLAITSDIRVLLVKLADRLHNMRTLGYIDKPTSAAASPRRRWTSMRRWLGRIGMQNMREELEDLAFAELDPEARNSIVTHFARLDMVGGDRVGRIADQIKRKLAEHGMEAWVYGRGKRPFSIWRKLQTKKLSFEQLSDIFGFRRHCGLDGGCYQRAGHHPYQLADGPERFKDFISTPKPNGYRSIHTTGDRSGKAARRKSRSHPGNA
jgi:(p)ppGpp synthase/HD superfamily hydrolase